MKDTNELKNGLSEIGEVNSTIHVYELMTLRPIDVRMCQPADIEERSQQYFLKCAETNMTPTVAGFALALGMDRRKLQDVVAGRMAIPDDNREEINKYYTALNALLESYVLNCKTQVVGGIFLLKNNFGYKDQQEFVLNNTNNDTVSEEALLEEANLLLAEPTKKANNDD